MTVLSKSQETLLDNVGREWGARKVALAHLEAKHMAQMRAAMAEEKGAIDGRFSGALKAALDAGVPMNQIKEVTTKAIPTLKALLAPAAAVTEGAQATAGAPPRTKPLFDLFPDYPNLIDVTITTEAGERVSAAFEFEFDAETGALGIDPHKWSNTAYVAEHGEENPVYVWMYEKGGDREVAEWLQTRR